MPTMTVPSAALRRLRREGLEISRRRIRAALAPTGGVAVAKKPSSQPPPYAYVLALPAPLPRSNPAAWAAASAAGSRSRHAAAPTTAARAEVISRRSSKCIGKGAQVRVRTRVGVARSTGQRIVIWLRAVVDSAADEDGYLHVTYSYTNGKLPRVARVAPRDIRLHDDVSHADDARCAAAPTAGSSSAVTSDRSAPAPRQTVAGKKLRLLLQEFEEMKNR